MIPEESRVEMRANAFTLAYRSPVSLDHHRIRCESKVAHISLNTGFLDIHTHTPVLSIESSRPCQSAASDDSTPDRSPSWTISTSRGIITTPNIIIASNAYTSGILPEFRDKIVPVRGTACSIIPPASHFPRSMKPPSDSSTSDVETPSAPASATHDESMTAGFPIRSTYGLRFGPGESDYLIARQKPESDGTPGRIILGGAKGCFQHQEKEWYDSVRDDQEMPGVRSYFEGYMQRIFQGWEGGGECVDKVWSGGTSLVDL